MSLPRLLSTDTVRESGFRLIRRDRVTMRPAEKCDNIALSVNDQGEHLQNVSSQDAHIESSELRAGGVVAAERDSSAVIAHQSNSRADDDCIDLSANAANAIGRCSRCDGQRGKHIRADHRAIRARVNQQFERTPISIACLDLSANDRPHDPVVALKPFTVEAHRCGPVFRSGDTA